MDHERVKAFSEKLDSISIAGKSHERSRSVKKKSVICSFHRLSWPEQSRTHVLFEQRSSGAFHDRSLQGDNKTVRNFRFCEKLNRRSARESKSVDS